MRDRIPTQVLDNGAIRYAVYDEQGNFLRYEYMLAADEPTDEGTPLNKATLLTDETAAHIWPDEETRPEEPTVDGALSKLRHDTAISPETAAGLGLNGGDPTVDEALRLTPLIRLENVYTTPPPLKSLSTPTALSVSRNHLAATTVGNYALFGGGLNYSSSGSYTQKNTVDAYTSTLVRSTPTVLSEALSGLAATTVGNYALFSTGSSSESVNAYSRTLIRSIVSSPNNYHSGPAATTVGDYALFGGGNSVNSYPQGIVDAYTSTLVHSTPTVLSSGRRDLAATTVGNYALFGGGVTYSGSSYPMSSTVDAYTNTLVRSTPTALSSARNGLAATTVGNCALFGGGGAWGNDSTVDTYTSTLVRSTPTVLSAARGHLAATTVGNYALFGGGYNNGGNSYLNQNTVDAYTNTLVRSTLTALSAARSSLAATTIGNYALFGGGSSFNSSSSRTSSYSTVDAYIDLPTTDITIPAWSKYKFDGFHTDEQFTMTDLDFGCEGTLTGYIKRAGFTVSGKI